MLTERLQTEIDREVEGSPRARELLGQLEGRSLSIEARYTPWQVTLHALDGKLILDRSAPPGDARLSGTPLALLSLTRGNPAEVIRRGEVRIEGDALVAERFQELALLLRPDLEDTLARIVGDVPAHGLGRLLRGVLDYGRQSARTAADNVGEYLTHERRELVPRAEGQVFIDEVDGLRERTDRLAARVAELERSGDRS